MQLIHPAWYRALDRRVDVTQLGPKLYQGGLPPVGGTLRRAGFRTVVLCAEEYQPRSREFHDVEVIRMPLDDIPEPLSPDLARKVIHTAQRVARRVASGRRTLVTCAAGLNRSGLVNGLALRMLTGANPRAIIAMMRSRRGMRVLCNREFERFVRRARL